MRHVIIGTAGHVDHGKTSLVKALTGVGTDRLPEEKKRGLSIELGFAPLVLKNGMKVGIVDVPGHEKFIKNMLAGITGIDLVIFVIAADEGIMPQTEEHLNILDLLGVKKGIMVVTKCDLVDDKRLSEVVEDVRIRISDTSLASSRIMCVSSTTGSGVDDLLDEIDRLVKTSLEEERPSKFVRLPIDRVFKVQGHGIVVTGTLVGGEVRVGDRMQLIPSAKEVKVRQVQVHDEPVEVAHMGQRVALNLSGVDKDDVKRGMVVGAFGLFEETTMLDVNVRLIEGFEGIEHRQRLRLHTGSSEVLCRIRTVGTDFMKAKTNGFAQLELEEPICAVHGDHFIIRSYSPVNTIGGGQVLFHKSKRHKRFSTKTLKEMEALNSCDFNTLVKGAMEILSTEGSEGEGEEIYPVELKDIALSLAFDYGAVISAVEEGAKGQNPLYVKLNERRGDDPSMLVLFKGQYDELCKRICAELESFHKSNPLKAGVGREELRSKVCRLWDNKMFSDMLAKMVEEGKVKLVGNEVSLSSHKVIVSQENDLLVNFVERAFTEQLFAPPSKSKVMTDCKSPRSCESVFKFLQDNGRLVRVGPDMFFHRDAVDKSLEVAKKLGTTGEGFTVAQFRDEVGTSRKYAVALLEYMDNQKKTRRNGDYRKFMGK